MKSRVSRLCVLLSLLSLAVIFGPNIAYASPGSLDPTFGQGGKVVSSFGSPILVSNAALQSDGKILVLISNDLSNFVVARFLANGSLDTTFGSGGSAQTIFANFNFPGSVAVQSDGKIVVTGIATNDETNYAFVAARFNANGSLDSTFGAGGQAAAPVAGLLEESVGLIQPDGRILVAGATIINPRAATDLAMARFNSDGSLDGSFGINGSVVQLSAALFCSSLGLDAAGHIFVVGGNGIAEFNSNGSALAQVTPAAIVTRANGGGFGATAFQPDGRFVFARTVAEGSPRNHDFDTQVARFTATGAVDPTFNSLTFDFVGAGGTSVFDVTRAVGILSNGQIVLGASHTAGINNQVFVLARLNSNGNLDPTFGAGGVVTTSVGGVEGAAALLAQPDGKIIVIGTANDFADVALVRYLP